MGIRSALSHRYFLVLWMSQLAARTGESIQELALIWLVYEITGAPSLLALMVAATTVPTVVSSLPAGSLVDSVNRKWLLILSNLARGFLILLIPVVGMTAYFIPLVLGIAVITGLIQAVALPARGALIPNLVSRDLLDAANALISITQSFSRFLYILGGFAIAYLGIFSVFFLTASGFLLAAGLLLGIPSEFGQTHDRTHRSPDLYFGGFLGKIREGVRFVIAHDILPSVVLLSLLTTLALAPLAVVLPFYISTLTGGGSIDFGVLYGAIYLGIFSGAVLIAWFDALTKAYRGPMIMTGLVFTGVTLLMVAMLPQVTPHPLHTGFMGFFAFGVAFTIVNTPIQTLVQTIVPNYQRGIVFGVLATVTLPALPLGAIVAGFLLEYITPTSVLFWQGVLLVVIFVPLALGPLGRTGTALNF